MDKEKYLKKYHKNVQIIVKDFEQIDEIPISWKNILKQSNMNDKIEKTIDLWNKYMGLQFRNTIRYLKEKLVGIELIKYGEKYSLLYSILSSNNKILYYEGGNPNGKLLFGKLEKEWESFDKSIINFYQNLHDGFFYYASESMGLLPVQDIVYFDDEEWGIIEELETPLEICLATTFGIFASGMGGYVAIDTSCYDKSKATLWFTNRQPSYNIDFWDIVDEWTVIGMQG